MSQERPSGMMYGGYVVGPALLSWCYLLGTDPPIELVSQVHPGIYASSGVTKPHVLCSVEPVMHSVWKCGVPICREWSHLGQSDIVIY